MNVTSAKYEDYDVLEIVKSLVKNDTLFIVPNNTLFGFDPKPFVRKTLYLTIDGKNYEAIENEIFEYPESLFDPQTIVFKAFYHIACIGNWKSIIVEQKEVFDRVGLQVSCGVLGNEEDIGFIRSLGFNIEYASSNLQEYEVPTLKLLYDWSKNNPSGAVLYCHTKGVSKPYNIATTYWRWLMMESVVEKWKDNLLKLLKYNTVGYNFFDMYYPKHFSGNFWISRCDYINALKDPIEYQKLNQTSRYGPWEKMCAEFWIGTGINIKAFSLIIKNHRNPYDKNNTIYQKFKNK